MIWADRRLAIAHCFKVLKHLFKDRKARNKMSVLRVVSIVRPHLNKGTNHVHRSCFRHGKNHYSTNGITSATFGLTSIQHEIQSLAESFASEEFAPHAAKWDEEKIFPEDALRKAASLGFAGVFVKEDVGGSGLGRVDGSIIFEALAGGCTRYPCSST